MLMQFLLQIFMTYIPLVYGVYLCANKQTSNKVSIEKLIKFTVLRVILSLFQHIIIDLVEFNQLFTQFSMLLIYIYLTLYNYHYAEGLYNIVIAPFMNIFSQMVTNIDNEVASHKKKLNLIKAMEHQKDKTTNQNIKLQSFGFINKFIYNAFNDPLTFPQTDNKT